MMKTTKNHAIARRLSAPPAMPTTAVASVEADYPLTEKEAAPLLGVSVKTLQFWRFKKIGPPYLKYAGGKAVRYLRRALLEWRDAQLVQGDHGMTG